MVINGEEFTNVFSVRWWVGANQQVRELRQEGRVDSIVDLELDTTFPVLPPGRERK
jgi:hypothetical protein